MRSPRQSDLPAHSNCCDALAINQYNGIPDFF